MIVLTATCKNGTIALDHPLPSELEGKEIEITIREQPITTKTPKKRRQSGSAEGLIWMSADFDLPLEDFQDYTMQIMTNESKSMVNDYE